MKRSEKRTSVNRKCVKNIKLGYTAKISAASKPVFFIEHIPSQKVNYVDYRKTQKYLNYSNRIETDSPGYKINQA